MTLVEDGVLSTRSRIPPSSYVLLLLIGDEMGFRD